MKNTNTNEIIKISIIGIIYLSIIAVFVFLNSSSSVSYSGLLKQGDSYLKEGKFGLAQTKYEKIVRLYPNKYTGHIRLARLYEMTDNPLNAKVEYYRAIRLENKKSNEAQLMLADLYIKENQFELAKDLLLNTNDKKDPKVNSKLGDIYIAWSDKTAETDYPEALRKMLKALQYHSMLQGNKKIKTSEKLVDLYTLFAKKLIAENNADEAIKQLDFSLKIIDKPYTHYMLGDIYKNIDQTKAIDEYKKAYNMNKNVGNFDGYKYLLIKQGNEFYAKGKIKLANIYYEQASIIQRKTTTLPTINKDVLLKIISTKFNKDSKSNQVFPGITMIITNLKREPIANLKAKVIFYVNNNILCEVIKNISTKNQPLEANSSSGQITVFSTKTLNMKDGPYTKIEVYLSGNDKDGWKLHNATNIY